MNPLDEAARALYVAAAQERGPDWDQLGEATKSVWRERVVEQLGFA